MTTATRKPRLNKVQKTYAVARGLLETLQAKLADEMDQYDLDTDEQVEVYVRVEMDQRARLGLSAAEKALDVARDDLLTWGQTWATRNGGPAIVQMFDEIRSGKSVAHRQRLVEVCMGIKN